MFWFVLLLFVLGGGFYFYQRMLALEQEIRAEQEREKELQAKQVNQETAAAAPRNEEPERTVAAADNPATEIAENPILQFVCAHPGVVQADLYADIPQLNKKQAQQMIRELVDAGKIRRERLGSSFKLYLA
jgi:hypothetical protein